MRMGCCGGELRLNYDPTGLFKVHLTRALALFFFLLCAPVGFGHCCRESNLRPRSQQIALIPMSYCEEKMPGYGKWYNPWGCSGTPETPQPIQVFQGRSNRKPIPKRALRDSYFGNISFAVDGVRIWVVIFEGWNNQNFARYDFNSHTWGGHVFAESKPAGTQDMSRNPVSIAQISRNACAKNASEMHWSSFLLRKKKKKSPQVRWLGLLVSYPKGRVHWMCWNL